MFDKASLKLGLDKAVLKSMKNDQNPVSTFTKFSMTWAYFYCPKRWIQEWSAYMSTATIESYSCQEHVLHSDSDFEDLSQ